MIFVFESTPHKDIATPITKKKSMTKRLIKESTYAMHGTDM